MDGNNRPTAHDQDQITGQHERGSAGMEAGDWRAQISKNSRKMALNQIMQKLKSNFACYGPELQKIQKTALYFERTMYSAATSQSDYIRKISSTLLKIDSRSPAALSKSQGTASLAASSQIGSEKGRDWQEEVYQKIKSMQELYGQRINHRIEMYQRRAAELQQNDSTPHAPNNAEHEKLNINKKMCGELLKFLRTAKNAVRLAHKDNLVHFEKQIIGLLQSTSSEEPLASDKGQLEQSQMLAIQQPQRQQHLISQKRMHEDEMISQIQSLNENVSFFSAPRKNLSSLQHNSLTLDSIASIPRRSMMGIQHVAMNSLHRKPASGVQQMYSTLVSSQSGSITSSPAVTHLEENSQAQLEPQMFSNQEQQNQQQCMLGQHFMLQQLELESWEQLAQLSARKITQPNQINDTNDVKLRPWIGGKPGFLQSHASGQRQPYDHRLMNFRIPISSESEEVLPVSSPGTGYHSCPLLEKQYLPMHHTRAGTPRQSANLPFVAPEPRTPVARSLIPCDLKKIVSGISSLSNIACVNSSTPSAPLPNQQLAAETSDISASPITAEVGSPDDMIAIAGVVEQPLIRLMKSVKSLSPEALNASIKDIRSVVSLTDKISGSVPGNGSRAAIGEDLVASTNCHLQSCNRFKRMRLHSSAMENNVVSSTGSIYNSLSYIGNEFDEESNGVSGVKRPREAYHVLEEELREINLRLIDTVVHISVDVDPTQVAAGAGFGEGTVVNFSFTAVSLGLNLNSGSLAKMTPIQPLRVLILKDYPHSSPVILDKFPTDVSKEHEDLSMKTQSRFSIALRTLAEPMSLGDIARTWDECARGVVSEFAQSRGGGTFSSRYGTWEACLSAA